MTIWKGALLRAFNSRYYGVKSRTTMGFMTSKSLIGLWPFLKFNLLSCHDAFLYPLVLVPNSNTDVQDFRLLELAITYL
jgi:hypothetical protein